jgi:endoglucanase
LYTVTLCPLLKEIAVDAPRALMDLLSLPTAAFREQRVLDYLEQACAALPEVTTRRDQHGNLVARYTVGPEQDRPLVFTAHTDHPSFVAKEMRDETTLRAEFRGGVRVEYFAGEGVVFWEGDGRVRGIVRGVESTHPKRNPKSIERPHEVTIDVEQPVSSDAIGMWDLPDPEVRAGCVYARGCDDIAGCAAALEMLVQLSADQAETDVLVLFTRAEEVGFVGAIAAAETGTIPKQANVIAIETSKALPTAPIGAGPILRIGDRMTVFTPMLSAAIERVALELSAAEENFQYQRRLMDGGTCEASAYLAYGYATTGICIALGNYHNMNDVTEKIDSEYVSLADWHAMVRWFVALATADLGDQAQAEADKLREYMARIRDEHANLLASTAGQ